MNDDINKPSYRKPLGVLFIILLLAIYAATIAEIAGPILRLPALAQAPIWLFLGIIWIFPMRPLVRWIETGRSK